MSTVAPFGLGDYTSHAEQTVAPVAPAAPVIPAVVPVTAVKQPNTMFARYAAVLFTALITVGSAVQILPAHHDAQSLVQFGIILAGVIGTALSSVTSGRWPGVFKTGSAAVAAILTLLVPYLADGASFSSFTYTTWITFGVAAASALATELGVNIRTVANAKVEENLLK